MVFPCIQEWSSNKTWRQIDVGMKIFHCVICNTYTNLSHLKYYYLYYNFLGIKEKINDTNVEEAADISNKLEETKQSLMKIISDRISCKQNVN